MAQPANDAMGAQSTTSAGVGVAASPTDGVSLTRLHTVVPALRSRVVRQMTALHALGLPVRVTQGRRTVEEQEQLWAQGRTAPGPIVTWMKHSKHLTGRAVDFVWRTPDGGVTYKGPWDLLGMAAEELGLVWGGRWSRPLASADIRFAQVVRVYSERGALQVHSGGGHSRVKPHMASIFADCGIDVVSLASNHAMDWGGDALLDTVALFRDKGFHVIGAGKNLREARRPAIVEQNGVTTAFLAYCSVLQTDYAAGPDKVGVAPLRAHTYYEAFDYQAGVPPRVVTVPHDEDLAGMIEDIAAARRQADAVVLSLHWGIHFIPRMIADYQVTIADAAFRAGADLMADGRDTLQAIFKRAGMPEKSWPQFAVWNGLDAAAVPAAGTLFKIFR